MGIFLMFKKVGIIASIILIIVGFAFVSVPDKVALAVDWIISIGILIAGIWGVIRISRDKENNEKKVIRMLPSILCLLLGFYLLLFPFTTFYMIGIVIGILALLAAISQFSNAATAKKSNMGMLPFIIMGIINLLFAAGMFTASYKMVSFLVILIGVYLIILGGMSLYSALSLRKATTVSEENIPENFGENEVTVIDVDSETVDFGTESSGADSSGHGDNE